VALSQPLAGPAPALWPPRPPGAAWPGSNDPRREVSPPYPPTPHSACRRRDPSTAWCWSRCGRSSIPATAPQPLPPLSPPPRPMPSRSPPARPVGTEGSRWLPRLSSHTSMPGGGAQAMEGCLSRLQRFFGGAMHGIPALCPQTTSSPAKMLTESTLLNIMSTRQTPWLKPPFGMIGHLQSVNFRGVGGLFIAPPSFGRCDSFPWVASNLPPDACSTLSCLLSLQAESATRVGGGSTMVRLIACSIKRQMERPDR
jgi:hypothetical protein